MQKVETAQPGFAGGVELARAEARGHRVQCRKVVVGHQLRDFAAVIRDVGVPGRHG
jgi:hypothetical protein